MKRNIIIKTVAFSLAISLLSIQGVFAAGAEIPKEFGLEKITPYATINDVIRCYDTYQGETLTVEEIRYLPSGAKAYYIGTVKFTKRYGSFFSYRYRYWGDFNKFKFIKIVNPDGSIITPTSLGDRY